MNIGSYPKIWALGHAGAARIFDGPVLIEEKVDGSQFSFCTDGERVFFRSKGTEIHLDEQGNPDSKMFGEGVRAVSAMLPHLTPGWVYRGEYLQKPKHNTNNYGRVPVHHVILFDVQTGVEQYLSPEEKAVEAGRLGLEVVPVVHHGPVASFEEFQHLLNTESVLGGCKIEGLVIKNYAQFGPDGKALMAKFVSEAFKESHKARWGAANPSGKDVAALLIASLRTEARWRKAVQRLRDEGAIQDDPRDIGPLLKSISSDTHAEEQEQIKAVLFKHFWPGISRGVTAGFPQWYKEQLAQRAF